MIFRTVTPFGRSDPRVEAVSSVFQQAGQSGLMDELNSYVSTLVLPYNDAIQNIGNKLDAELAKIEQQFQRDYGRLNEKSPNWAEQERAVVLKEQQDVADARARAQAEIDALSSRREEIRNTYYSPDFAQQVLANPNVLQFTPEMQRIAANEEKRIADEILRSQPWRNSSTLITDEMRKQAERDPYYAAQLQDPNLARLLVESPEEALQLRLEDRSNRINSIRTQLESQYNNIVGAGRQQGQDLSYRGRSSDLPTIFNQQAAQLADAGVTNIANLRIQNGTLVDSSTGKTVTNSNLGGQVYTDRDTGVQKWGDIFSGVQGGANYGIQALQDGSVVLFPAWEKTKSPISQIGLGGLENIIEPALAIAGAYFGAPGISNAIGAAAGGAALGSTAGQLLASGQVDWEKVALSAGVAAGGAYISGAGNAAAPDLTGTTGGMTGADYGFVVSSPEMGLLADDLAFLSADAAQLYQQTGDVAAVQQNLIAAGVDPIMAAEASNLAAFGGTAESIAASLAKSFPGETVFTSQGLLSGGSTMDEFAKKIGGDITSTGGGLGLTDAFDALSSASKLGGLLGGPQQQGLLGGGGGMMQTPGRAPGGVDYSALLASLSRQASVPGVAPLIGPVVQPQESLLGMQVQPVQYQPLNRSLLG